MNTDQEKDYCNDGLCTADIFQEKDCAGFKSMAGSGMCLHQGLGFVCEWAGKDNEKLSGQSAELAGYASK